MSICVLSFCIQLRKPPSGTQRQQAPPQQQQYQMPQQQYQPYQSQGQQYLQQQRHSISNPSQQYQQYQQYQQNTRPASTSSPQFPSSTIGSSDLKASPRPDYLPQAQPYGGYQQQQQQQQGNSSISTTPIMQQQHQQSTFEDRQEQRRPSSERFQISLPLQPTEFPELQTLQLTQLERFLKDDVAIQCHASNMDCVETLRSMRNDVRKSNAADAQRNLKKRDEMRTEEEEILILQNNLRAVATSYKRKLAQYRGQHAQSLSKEAVLAQLHANLTAQDDRTENMAQQFVSCSDQEVEVQAFLKEYVQCRAQYHALNVSLKRAA